MAQADTCSKPRPSSFRTSLTSSKFAALGWYQPRRRQAKCSRTAGGEC
jgi:hypothetical protein